MKCIFSFSLLCLILIPSIFCYLNLTHITYLFFSFLFFPYFSNKGVLYIFWTPTETFWIRFTVHSKSKQACIHVKISGKLAAIKSKPIRNHSQWLYLMTHTQLSHKTYKWKWIEEKTLGNSKTIFWFKCKVQKSKSPDLLFDLRLSS